MGEPQWEENTGRLGARNHESPVRDRIGNGFDGARSIQSAELKAVSTSRNIERVSDQSVLNDLNFSSPPSTTRNRARAARRLRLSLYDTRATNGR